MNKEIQSYQDLRVWQVGMDLAERCYSLTKSFPKDEIYGMTSQIRRSAVSVPANIAEGYGREYRKEYMHFLRISQGSLKELETHIILSGRIGYLSAENVREVLLICESLGKSLRALIRALEGG
jgi:four helix bundle protein